MKQMKYMALTLLLLVLWSCKEEETTVDFALERNRIEVGPTGAKEYIVVRAGEDWIASTDNPWITISPANGRGTTTCEFRIDSALTAEPRQGVVRIQNLSTWAEREIVISQEGYPYTIELEEPDVQLSNFAAYGSRYFDVKVKTNVDFEVEIPENAGWLMSESHTLLLDRGIRPREVTVRFNWDINTLPEERLADVVFKPKKEVTLARQDLLNVRQSAAEPIVENTRGGDSVALLSIQRSLATLSSWDPSTPMTTWSNVTLWEEGDEGCTPEMVGRVRSAQFMLFNTKEGLPYAVKYLTAAEELYFFGNTNTFLLDLSTGDHISELTQLKRLTIGAYGLVELPRSFAKLQNLEYLNLGSNNFPRIPGVLTKENFPHLRHLILNANQRSSIYDLSNTTRTNLGGFIEEPEFPVELLKWDLETLVLSVNYLQGELPDFLDDDTVPYYTQEDIDRVDTLPQFLVDRKIKKVMPSTTRFSINHNRLSGKLPDWLLYHPALDWWYPTSLVFPQEGRAQDGTQAVFENEPVNMNYYYDIYTSKDKPEAIEE